MVSPLPLQLRTLAAEKKIALQHVIIEIIIGTYGVYYNLKAHRNEIQRFIVTFVMRKNDFISHSRLYTLLKRLIKPLASRLVNN